MIQIIYGDVFEKLKEVKEKSIQSIITSPPYFRLRDYGHENQIGWEESTKSYIENLGKVFQLCKEKLKDDGLLFIVISDTYYYPRPEEIKIWGKNGDGTLRPGIIKEEGYKKSSLLCIPQRLTIKLIELGYVFRQQIVWQKPRCMPESTKKRFTNDYEVVLMFSKKEKYKFNQLKEEMKTKDLNRPRGSKGVLKLNSGLRQEKSNKKEYLRNMRAVWSINNDCLRLNHFATFPEELVRRLIKCSTDENDIIMDPFLGSGTTLKVARQLNRNGIGIELKAEYINIAKRRIGEDLFNRIEVR